MQFVVLGDVGRRHLYHVGDEAMTSVAIEMLSSRGATRVTLVATHPDEANRLYGLPSVPRIGFGPRWSRSELESSLRRITRDPVAAGELNEAVRNADAVLIAGGGNMTSQFTHHIYERLVLTRLARAHEKPLLITSQTIGPYLHADDKPLLVEILESSVIFGARDDATFELARTLSPNANVWRTSDDAILLRTTPGHRDLAARLRCEQSRFIAASFTSDSGESGLDRHTYLDLIASTLDRLAKEHDADVLLIPHAGSLDGPLRKLDELSDHSIVERSASSRIRALSTMTARQTLAVMQGSLLSLSTRYHPVVFAPTLGIPTLGISLSSFSNARMGGALRGVGLSDAVTPAIAWPTVDEAADELMRRQEELYPWLIRQSDARREEQHAWWDVLMAGTSGDAPRQEAVGPCPSFPFDGGWVTTSANGRKILDRFDQASTVARWQADEIHRIKAENAKLQKRLETEKVSRKQADERLQRERSRKSIQISDKIGSLLRPHRSAVQEVAEDPLTSQVLLSVVVPIYNVEPYLDECLTSIVAQTLTDLQIILIDDGSTDQSSEIARRYAENDSRIHLISQENQGLGAVRNRGSSLATGRYLTFVDSDDVLPEEALEALVGSLEKSGSDLALGAVNRIRPDGTIFTPGWVRTLHTTDRTTTLTESPEILRNFYTWNKVFSTDFWRTHGFQFREGVLFEDQPVITEAFHRAETIDVLGSTVYRWRIRDDDSSLTGKMYSERDIAARHDATLLTEKALASLNSPDHVVDAWLWTLAEFHFPNYLQKTVEDPGSYSAALSMVLDFLSVEKLATLRDVSAAKKSLLYLALTSPREDVAVLVGVGTRTADFGLEHSGKTTSITVPNLLDGAPSWVTRVSPHEQEMIGVVRSHTWNANGTLTLVGMAGVSNLPPAEQVTLRLTLQTDHERIELPATTTVRLVSDLPRKYGVTQWVDFSTTIDFPALLATHESLLTQDVSVHLRLDLDRTRWRAPFNRFPNVVSLSGSTLPSSRQTVMASWTREEGLSFRIHPRPITSSEIDISDDVLRLHIRCHAPNLDPVFLIAKVKGEPERRSILLRTAPGNYMGSIDLDWLNSGSTAQISILDDAGNRRKVHAPGVQLQSASSLVTTTARGASLRVERPH